MTCARLEIRKLEVDTPRSFKPSNSFNNATGSTTTPLPITASLSL